MDFYEQKSSIKLHDLRIGNLIKYGVVQTHIITGINYEDNSVKIRPDTYYTSGKVRESFALNYIGNKKEIIVSIDKVSSCPIYLKELNDYGFIWLDPYKVYYLINNYKLFIESFSSKSATIIYESPKLTISRDVYSLHELQNVFNFISGADFLDIRQF